jgi:3-hydroxyacyl-CoA dehydrogenase
VNDSPPITRAGVVGTGVVGAAWAACFLARGLDVTATDPAPGAEARLRADVRAHWPILERLGLADGASPDRLTFTDRLEEAVASAGFVQENGPERDDVKQELFRAMDAVAPPDVVLASSSSGIMPSVVQATCERHPERVLIGHPFNPAHLIPLVEVVGGERTGEAAIARAMSFYAAMGKHPIHLRAELPGHLANRLQAALWREAYSLVDQGLASVADIDAAIAHGPGLRWALMGPLMLHHLSGGPGGIAHVLEHLGPPMEEWWQAMQTPRLTPELIDAAVAGVGEELAGADVAAMVAERDALLIDLLAAKAAATHLP